MPELGFAFSSGDRDPQELVRQAKAAEQDARAPEAGA